MGVLVCLFGVGVYRLVYSFGVCVVIPGWFGGDCDCSVASMVMCVFSIWCSVVCGVGIGIWNVGGGLGL